MSAGYEPARVFRYLAEHGTLREADGRLMRLHRSPVQESHRNTVANWEARRVARVPLGRWDEILVAVGIGLWEYELWEKETYGDLSFTDDAIVTAIAFD